MPSIHESRINPCPLTVCMACEECKYYNTCHRQEPNNIVATERKTKHG